MKRASIIYYPQAGSSAVLVLIGLIVDDDDDDEAVCINTRLLWLFCDGCGGNSLLSYIK